MKQKNNTNHSHTYERGKVPSKKKGAQGGKNKILAPEESKVYTGGKNHNTSGLSTGTTGEMKLVGGGQAGDGHYTTKTAQEQIRIRRPKEWPRDCCATRAKESTKGGKEVRELNYH